MQAGSAEVAFRLPFYNITGNEELGTLTALSSLLAALEANERCTESLGLKRGTRDLESSEGEASRARQASCCRGTTQDSCAAQSSTGITYRQQECGRAKCFLPAASWHY